MHDRHCVAFYFLLASIYPLFLDPVPPSSLPCLDLTADVDQRGDGGPNARNFKLGLLSGQLLVPYFGLRHGKQHK